MAETRTGAATLLCKVFLHYLVRLAQGTRMQDVWLKVLDVLDRLMSSDQSRLPGGVDRLEEQVPESLKNILLVMADGGYLIRPRVGGERRNDSSREEGESHGGDGKGGDERMWEETRRRVDRFLPGLFAEVFPEEALETEANAKAEAEMEAEAKISNTKEENNQRADPRGNI